MIEPFHVNTLAEITLVFGVSYKIEFALRLLFLEAKRERENGSYFVAMGAGLRLSSADLEGETYVTSPVAPDYFVFLSMTLVRRLRRFLKALNPTLDTCTNVCYTGRTQYLSVRSLKT
jgi:hypothetical protein